MGDDRPFVCSAPGCGQRFTNEDHLAVHKHKHELTLKFGPARTDSVIIADQTPTPTRFLKNCEEVGLFNELASSFEHEFKRAAEDEEKKARDGGITPSPREVQVCPAPGWRMMMMMMMMMMLLLLMLLMMQGLFRCRSPSGSLPLVVQLANGQTVPVLPGPPLQMPSVISVREASRAPAPSRDRPWAGAGGRGGGGRGAGAALIPVAVPVPVQVSPAQPTPSTGGRRKRAVDEDPDERRQRFLERNRAAASRCRQKRKLWVSSLEKKAEELTSQNIQLSNEVTLLRNEVAQLKQLLLAHKDCPVTALQKKTQGYLGESGAPGAWHGAGCQGRGGWCPVTSVTSHHLCRAGLSHTGQSRAGLAGTPKSPHTPQGISTPLLLRRVPRIVPQGWSWQPGPCPGQGLVPLPVQGVGCASTSPCSRLAQMAGQRTELAVPVASHVIMAPQSQSAGR
ncbi:PREDICTED: cyclic AMP-dependent transcription factor ATF-7-like [Ficedula albicollis]|uniref:cyclic AMP-dependent transcription factor ATF-7-like n=1 Tax=Ficedula albicollis TaxID=59894 RepID=UPI0007AD8BB4|nr:PREDICTED: cyclic AMP-dependent transcription factor ATF-7-like [Ficedula albicollis]